MKRIDFREALVARLELTGTTSSHLALRTGVSKGIIDKLRQRRIETTNVHDAMLIADFFGQSVEGFCGSKTSGHRTSMAARIGQEAAALPVDLQHFMLAQMRLLAKLER